MRERSRLNIETNSLPTPTAVAGVGFFTSVCLCVCQFSERYPKNDAAVCRIIKLDIEMFHDESWEPIYFGVTR